MIKMFGKYVSRTDTGVATIASEVSVAPSRPERVVFGVMSDPAASAGLIVRIRGLGAQPLVFRVNATTALNVKLADWGLAVTGEITIQGIGGSSNWWLYELGYKG